MQAKLFEICIGIPRTFSDNNFVEILVFRHHCNSVILRDTEKFCVTAIPPWGQSKYTLANRKLRYRVAHRNNHPGEVETKNLFLWAQ